MAQAEARFAEQRLQMEMADLRDSLLHHFLITLVALGWAWYPYMMFNNWALGPNVIPTVIAMLGCVFAYAAYRRSYALGAWLLLLSGVGFHISIILAHPGSNILSFGVLLIIVAQTLLGTGAASATASLLWTVASLARARGLGMALLDWPATIDMLVLYASAFLVSWIAARPLQAMAESALAGWAEARQALTETRQRRAEVYRALRALEEATARIQRMNDELMVARHEAELARAQKAKLAATISHELRGPLNLILGFSKMMVVSPDLYDTPLPEEYRADIDAVYRNSQHLSALIDDVLDLSQLEAEKLPLVKDRTDLEQDVISKAVEIVRPLAERKGLYLHEQLTGPLPWVLADAVRLRQVLLNLLTNAIRFTESGGITVSSAQVDGKLLVQVADTGLGIPADEIPKLFQEFRQVHPTESRESAGSGLGLSICKHLVQLHGGEIWVESEVSLGTTFSFTIPLPGSVPLTGSLKIGTRLPPKKIHQTCLILHNDARLVKLLARYIEGYRVVGVPDLDEAISLVDQLHPCAILTTPDCVRQLEQQLAARSFDVPIISCGLSGASQQVATEGVLSYLVKPITADMVTAVMHQIGSKDEMTILLVDDDPDTLRLLELMLTTIPRPYKILKAQNGRQALECMQTTIPDMVFIDLLMPEMDGWETIARMRGSDHLKSVPVVVVSARDWSEEGVVLDMPLCLHAQQEVDIAKGAKYLQSLFDLVTPRYLPEPGTLQQS